jgi:hypothetical protein
MAEAKRSPARILAAKRQKLALEYRTAGLTYAQIATQLGYAFSENAAYKAVEAGLLHTAARAR